MKIRKRVAVIGAGPSGLVAARELLDQGHEVTCFERESTVGGLFRDAKGATYRDMRLTVSQHFMAFSSFPPSLDEKREYWSRETYLEYLRLFVEHFSIDRVVRGNCPVIGIEDLGTDFAVASLCGGTRQVERFDAVAVCRGAFRPDSPRMPDIDGLDDFDGEVLHSTSYVCPEPFRGQRVLCIGMGETAADVLNQVSDVADSCTVSVRHQGWLVPRWPYGPEHTNDAYSTRLRHWNPQGSLGKSRDRLRQKMASIRESDVYQRMGPAERYIFDWNSESEVIGHRSAQKNCDFVDAVIAGRLNIVPHGVSRVTGRTVEFLDGSSCEVDSIILCTGYEESSLPVPSGWLGIPDIQDVRELYKHAFHPRLRERVAFIGWARPEIGGFPVCSEMVARYFSLLCSGECELPPPDDLDALIAVERCREDEDYYAQPYMRTLVQYTRYLDGLAELIGCDPHLEDYLDEPEFLFRILCGSNIGATYRLRGPQAMEKQAREWITSLPVAVPGFMIRDALGPMLRAKYAPDLADRIAAACEPFIDDASLARAS